MSCFGNFKRIVLGSALLSITFTGGSAVAQVGIFEEHRDIGTVLHPGNATFDSAKGAYTVSGSGDNMWFGSDDFHFMWKRATGDMAISADISFVGAKGNNHRKAALLFRQSLAANSIYADVALHGDGSHLAPVPRQHGCRHP